MAVDFDTLACFCFHFLSNSDEGKYQHLLGPAIHRIPPTVSYSLLTLRLACLCPRRSIWYCFEMIILTISGFMFVLTLGRSSRVKRIDYCAALGVPESLFRMVRRVFRMTRLGRFARNWGSRIISRFRSPHGVTRYLSAWVRRFWRCFAPLCPNLK